MLKLQAAGMNNLSTGAHNVFADSKEAGGYVDE
jgi:hypothetical protein